MLDKTVYTSSNIASINPEIFMLYWVFKNDHVYNKAFDNEYAALEFMNRCGLVSHPDILVVSLFNAGKTKVFKGVNNEV